MLKQHAVPGPGPFLATHGSMNPFRKALGLDSVLFNMPIGKPTEHSLLKKENNMIYEEIKSEVS